MEISGLPYIAKASDAVPFNAVVNLDVKLPVATEAVSTSLMPGNEESSTLRDLPARDIKNVMHPSVSEGLPQVLLDTNSGMMQVGEDRLGSRVPEISMFDGKGYILDHWA